MFKARLLITSGEYPGTIQYDVYPGGLAWQAGSGLVLNALRSRAYYARARAHPLVLRLYQLLLRLARQLHLLALLPHELLPLDLLLRSQGEAPSIKHVSNTQGCVNTSAS